MNVHVHVSRRRWPLAALAFLAGAAAVIAALILTPGDVDW